MALMALKREMVLKGEEVGELVENVIIIIIMLLSPSR